MSARGAFALALVVLLSGCAGAPQTPADAGGASAPPSGTAAFPGSPPVSPAASPAVASRASPSPGSMDPHGGLAPICFVSGFHTSSTFDAGIPLERAEARARFNASLEEAGFTVSDDEHELQGRRNGTVARASPDRGTNWTLRLDWRIVGQQHSCSEGGESEAWSEVEAEILDLHAQLAASTSYSWNGTVSRSPQRVTS